MLGSQIDSCRKDKDAAERILKHSMDSSTSKGLDSIKRLKQKQDIPGAYGTVAELMEVPLDAYRLPVEQKAGNSLFHYVVDNDNTASILSDYLSKNYGGRITFIPLEQIHTRKVKMPRASDAQPLLDKIDYDPQFEKAFQQIFGRDRKSVV